MYGTFSIICKNTKKARCFFKKILPMKKRGGFLFFRPDSAIMMAEELAESSGNKMPSRPAM
jgi:hypothetical protein